MAGREQGGVMAEQGWEPRAGERVRWDAGDHQWGCWRGRGKAVVVGPDPGNEGWWVVRDGPLNLGTFDLAHLSPLPRTVTVTVEVPVEEAEAVNSARAVARFRAALLASLPAPASTQEQGDG